MSAKGADVLKREERAKAVQGCFERSAAILKQHGSVLLSFHALSRAEGHRLESNEEVAEVCDLIFGAGYDHHLRGYRRDTCQKKIGYLF